MPGFESAFYPTSNLLIQISYFVLLLFNCNCSYTLCHFQMSRFLICLNIHIYEVMWVMTYEMHTRYFFLWSCKIWYSCWCVIVTTTMIGMNQSFLKVRLFCLSSLIHSLNVIVLLHYILLSALYVTKFNFKEKIYLLFTFITIFSLVVSILFTLRMHRAFNNMFSLCILLDQRLSKTYTFGVEKDQEVIKRKHGY